jgi:hypothetical protein
MRLHSVGLIAAGGALGLMAAPGWMAGCRSTSAQLASPSPGVAAQSPRALSAGVGPRDPDLCGSRPRCSVLRRETAPALAELIVLRLSHAPGASSDEDRCDHREYWLLRAGEAGARPAALLARDCEVQWGADNPGPAELHLERDRASLRYVEFESSDNCETYEATVLLASLTVAAQERWSGGSHAGRCERRDRVALVPLGNGSVDHPLLVLHP